MQRLVRSLVVLVGLVSLSSVHLAQEVGWRQNFTLLLGKRVLDDEALWGDLDEPVVTGFYFDFRPPRFGMGWEFSSLFSYDFEDDIAGPGTDGTGFMYELSVGGRFTADVHRFHPYFGTGLSLVFAETTIDVGGSESTEDDFTVGNYVHTGMYFQVNRSLIVGVDLRALFGTDIELGGFDGDADYAQVTAQIGWTF